MNGAFYDSGDTMTEAEAKSILNRYLIMKRKKLSLQKRIAEKRADITSLRGMITNRVAISRSGVSDPVESAIETIDTMVHDYFNLVWGCENAEKEALDLIGLIDDEELKHALFLRYIEGLSVEAAAERLYVSDRTCWNYCKRAISLICSKVK